MARGKFTRNGIEVNNIVGANLKRLMVAEGITQRMMSEWTGINFTTVNNYCNAKDRGLTLHYVALMADVLRVTVDDLMRAPGDEKR